MGRQSRALTTFTAQSDDRISYGSIDRTEIGNTANREDRVVRMSGLRRHCSCSARPNRGQHCETQSGGYPNSSMHIPPRASSQHRRFTKNANDCRGLRSLIEFY